MKRFSMPIALIATVFHLWGCSDDNKVRAGAAAKVAFANDTTAGLTASAGVPSTLKITVLHARLIQDVDDNSMAVGLPGFIYINPDCRRSDEELAADETGSIGTDDVDGCAHQSDVWTSGDTEITPTKIASTRIDFAKGSEAVNAELNAQNRSLDLGDVEEGEIATQTWRYIGVAFRIQTHTSEPNASWSFDATGAAEKEFTWIQNELAAIEIDPPLEISSNEKALITLSYDLAGWVQYGADMEEVELKDLSPGSGINQPGRADSCSGTVGTADYTCLMIPADAMTASVEILSE